jgi:hypothetical protein
MYELSADEQAAVWALVAEVFGKDWNRLIACQGMPDRVSQQHA